MSNQDMQFVDPDWEHPRKRGEEIQNPLQEEFRPQPINRDGPQQSQWSAPPPPMMERPSYPEMGPQQVPFRPYMGWRPQGYQMPRQRSRKPWVIVVAIGVMIMFGMGSFTGRHAYPGDFNGGRPYSVPLVTKSIAVSDHPKVIIHSNNGHITLHGSSNSNQVNISGTSSASDNTNTFAYDKTNNSVTINESTQGGDRPNFKGRDTNTNLDIAVPQDADVQINASDGQVVVNDVQGKMDIQTNIGQINMTNVHLTDGSSLKTGAGQITFDGSINAKGTYQFESDMGTIGVTLPNSSTFTVDAQTEVGSTHSDFPGIVSGREGTSSTLKGTVGSDPQAAKVTLKSHAGAIELQSSTR